jgi:hypothetical protein
VGGAEQKRSWRDRAMARARPRWVDGFAPAPRALAPGLWSVDRRLSIPLGPRLPARGLLVDLPGGGVLAWSPPPLGDALREFVRSRGGARFLIAPNSFHYLGLPEWQRAFPDARAWLAPGLRERRPELPPADELREGAATPFSAIFPHDVLDCGQGIAEVAFLHAPSRTLVLVDASFHLAHLTRARDRLAARLFGIPARFGPSRTGRLFLLRDRAAVAAWIERLCAWDFARIAMAHGDVLDGGPDALREAFRKFLPAG